MTSHQLTTDLVYTFDGSGTFWTIYKNDQYFGQIIADEKVIEKIVAFLNENMKED